MYISVFKFFDSVWMMCSDLKYGGRLLRFRYILGFMKQKQLIFNYVLLMTLSFLYLYIEKRDVYRQHSQIIYFHIYYIFPHILIPHSSYINMHCAWYAYINIEIDLAWRRHTIRRYIDIWSERSGKHVPICDIWYDIPISTALSNNYRLCWLWYIVSRGTWRSKHFSHRNRNQYQKTCFD